MAFNLVYVGVGLIVALTMVIVWFASRPSGQQGTCLEDTPCADKWVGSDNKPILNAMQVCDPFTLAVATPNIGPGQCANPCQAGETACWSTAQNVGTCIKGDSCPCQGDADCGGAGQGKCVNSACVCVPPWIGAHCESKTCVPGQTCGPHGDCDPADVNKCKCATGWATPPGGPPCSVCDDKWGPPGKCTGIAFPNKLGFVLAMSKTDANCVNSDTHSRNWVTAQCVTEFGEGSTAADGSTGDGFCHYSDGNPCCSSRCGGGGCNSNLPLCIPPNGFWADPKFSPDSSTWQPCAPAYGCSANRPLGFAGTY
jgi:hypothetical protein